MQHDTPDRELEKPSADVPADHQDATKAGEVYRSTFDIPDPVIADLRRRREALRTKLKIEPLLEDLYG